MFFRSFLAAALASVLLLVGCSDSNAPGTSAGGQNPGGAVTTPATVSSLNASAVVTNVVANGAVGILRPGDPALARTALGGDTQGFPALVASSSNHSGLALALAVAVKGSGSIQSPLGGSCTLASSGNTVTATFNSLQTLEGTVQGGLTLTYAQGDAGSDDFTANVQFQNLSIQSDRTLTFSGPASLQVVGGASGVDDVTWAASYSITSGQASVSFQNFVTETQFTAGGGTLTLNGVMTFANLNGVSGSVTVTTPTALSFTPLLSAGSVQIQASQLITLTVVDSNLLQVQVGGQPVKTISFHYLGGPPRFQTDLFSLFATTIIHNANIITVDDSHPRADSMAIQGTRILAVGSQAEADAFQGSNTQIVDMKGKTILPGFIEPHMHYDLTALHLCADSNSQLVECGLYNYNNPATQTISKQDVINALTAAVQANPNAAGIFGFNFDPSRLAGADFMQNITLAELDAISPTIPIVVQNASGHITYANSAAFRKAQVNGTAIWPTAPNAPYTAPSTSAFPAADIVVNSATGLPIGQMNEDAQGPFLAVGIAGALDTDAKRLQFAEHWKVMFANLGKLGITTAVDILMGAGTTTSLDGEAALVAALEADPDCPVRARIYVFGQTPIDKVNVFPGEGNSRMRFVGAKFITDGSTQGLTAGLNFPYLYQIDLPAGPNGLLDYVSASQLFMAIQPYYNAGWQLAFHGNGDAAQDQIFAALQMLGPDVPNRRSRIEHFTVHQTAELSTQLSTAAQLGIFPGHTIGHVFFWGQAFNDTILGADVSQNIDPVAAENQAGLKVSLHSDSPISPSYPLLFIQIAATRYWQVPPGGTPQQLGPQHIVSVLDAIKCVTINPATAAYSDNEVGSLEVGKLADLVILDQDPTAIDVVANPNAISQIPVLGTWMGGKLVSGSNP